MRLPSRDPVTLARRFWEDAGGGEAFPRPIETAVALVLPLTVVRLPALDVTAIGERLHAAGLRLPLPDDGRPLMGCLVARFGVGIVFLDGGDDPLEQRLTLAHEAAHFLLDYLGPRQDVLLRLGDTAADVLDGIRPPTVAERAAAVLRHVRLGPHVHRLARDGNEAIDPAVADAEARADELALELLAPKDEWMPQFGFCVGARQASPLQIAADLADRFAVPAHVFERIIRRRTAPRPVSFLQQAVAAVREGR